MALASCVSGKTDLEAEGDTAAPRAWLWGSGTCSQGFPEAEETLGGLGGWAGGWGTEQALGAGQELREDRAVDLGQLWVDGLRGLLAPRAALGPTVRSRQVHVSSEG